MPPKRKRVDGGAATEVPAPTRSTRSSTRNTAAKSAASEVTTTKTPKRSSTKAKAAQEQQPQVADDSPAPEPTAKRKKTTKAITNSSAEGKAKTKVAKKTVEDEPSSKSKPVVSQSTTSSASIPPYHPPSTLSSQQSAPQVQQVHHPAPIPAVMEQPQPQSRPQKQDLGKVEPYTTQHSLSLFSKYSDSDDATVIGPEGFERLCTDANIPLDGALPLMLSWQLDSKEMGKITKDEWTKGMGVLKIASLSALSIAMDDLQNLLIAQKPPLKKSLKKDQDPYDRTSYFSYSEDLKGSFQKFYSYCFLLAKQEGSRNIDMETSCALWSVLLVPRYPIMVDVLKFIEEKGTYRAVNKDLWSMMLEFGQTIQASLQDYEADGAWPTLLDDFVSWKKSKNTNDNGQENGIADH